MFATRRINRLLESGRLKELEEFLLRRCARGELYCRHLVHLYLEIQRYQKALEFAEKLVTMKPVLYHRYLYLVASYRAGVGVEKDRRLIADRLRRGDRKEGLFLLGITYLLEGDIDRAERHFRQSLESGFRLAHWGLSEVFAARGDTTRALIEARASLREASDFPPVLLQSGRLEDKLLKSMYLLFRYLSLVPISHEGRYELGMRLLEFSSVPILGVFFRKQAVKHLAVKALLESPKPENAWIYRLVALDAVRRGDYGKAAKWILIEQQVLYNTFAGLERVLKEGQEAKSEELLDMIQAALKLLVDGGVIEEEAFEKAYQERRETRLLEKMYQMSDEEEG